MSVKIFCQLQNSITCFNDFCVIIIVTTDVIISYLFFSVSFHINEHLDTSLPIENSIKILFPFQGHSKLKLPHDENMIDILDDHKV